MAVADTSRPPRGLGRRGRIIAVAIALLALLVGGFLLIRYGALAPQSRLLIEAQTRGLSIGRFGELQIEGLQGDIWDRFTIGRLTIADEEGVWLEARQVRIDWSYTQLLRRRFQAEEVAAEHVLLLRRPTLSPRTESRGLPISFDINALRARVEMTPQFAYERGVYDVNGALYVGRRNTGQVGRITARSVLNGGDHLDVAFEFGGGRRLRLDASAREAQGGALAGALGLPPNQPFLLNAQARETNGVTQFTAAARSGELSPLQAHGRWTDQGGRMRARIMLAASELTAPLARRIGSEVWIDVDGSPASGDLLNLQLRAASELVTLTAAGQADPQARRTGPQGLALDLYAAPAADLLPAPDLGASRLTGRLTGGAPDWRFDGTIAAEAVSLADYGLSRVSGPLQVAGRRGAIRASSRLSGQGGRGEGAAAALLGAAPVFDVQASRLTDGRIVFERVQARGAGLRVDATGGRGLLGRLNFRGDAEITNLQAIRPGAGGTLRLDWRASQAGGGAPWVIAFDSRGQRISTGFDELDRLLGPQPRLRAEGRWRAGQLAITEAVLNGRALQANAAGLVTGPEGLRLRVDWRADGPFGLGPVEVTGDARGTGALTGRLGAPQLDLTAQFDSVDLPRLPLQDARLTLRLAPQRNGQAGAFAVTAQSPYGPARARADLALPPGGVRLSNLELDAGGVRATGDVAVRRGAPAAADLAVDVGPGAFLTAGQVAGTVRIVDGRASPAVDLDLTARNAALRGAGFTIREGRATAAGSLANLPYQVTAAGSGPRGRWRLDGGGALSDQGPGYAATFAGEGALAGQTLTTIEPAVFRFGGDSTTARLRLAAADGGRIFAEATLGEAAAEIEAQASNLSLGLVNPDLAGRINAEVRLQGRGQQLTGDLTARMTDARGRGADRRQGLDAVVQGRLAGDVLRLTATATNEQGLRAQADVSLPAEASAAPLRLALHQRRPMSGTFSAQGEIQPLWDVFVGGERTLAGQASVSGQLAGTLANPRPSGQATIQNGQFVDGATGLALRNATVRANFTDSGLEVTQLAGVDGQGGRLTGAGRISLIAGRPSTFRVTLNDFQLIDNELAQASASGQATIERAGDGAMRIAGALTLTEAEISPNVPGRPPGVVTVEVTEINVPPHLVRQDLNGANGRPGVALDVKINAPRRVFVRGRGLDVELSVDAHVGGSTSSPQLTGTARVIRGDYEFAGARFIFDTTSLIYLSTDPNRVRLNLTARLDDPALTAVIRIAGTAGDPEIRLSSSPALPEDEILSQILFGRSASQLSTLEAAQLASGIAGMTGGGGFDLLGGLRGLAGLDRLALIGDEGSGLVVAGGRYLSDDVYLEIIGGGREGPAVQVEWRVNRRFSLVSRLMGERGAHLSVRWRRDY